MRSTIPLIALGLAVTSGLGCGGASRYHAYGTSASPGVDAEIAVGKTEGAQQIDLVVDHLTDPDRLLVGADEYSVWVVPEGGQPVYVGRLQYDRGSQRGRLRATTPYERFDLVVTAESGDRYARQRSWPTGPVVIERRVP